MESNWLRASDMVIGGSSGPAGGGCKSDFDDARYLFAGRRGPRKFQPQEGKHFPGLIRRRHHHEGMKRGILVITLLTLAAGERLAAQFPGSPAPAPAGPPIDPAKAIEKIDGTRSRLRLIEFDAKTRSISVPARVNMREGLLEYVLVHESGKLHESLFSTQVKPTEFNIVMLLLNWKPSGTFFDFSQPERGGVLVKGAKNPPESQVEIHVAWKDKDGKDQTCRLENWLHQIEKRAKLTEEPWIYTGSRIMPDGTFLAEQTGSILALYADPASIINNPREGNDLDDVWVNDPAVPEKGTPVTVIFKPVAAGPADSKANDTGRKSAEKSFPAPSSPAKKKSTR
jgi:hypothetical protein